MLSQTGRLVLIKIVINSLPMYYLGLIQISKAVAQKIISLQSRFFWGVSGSKKRMQTMKWRTIQLPKELEGLGVGDILLKNVALLYKW